MVDRRTLVPGPDHPITIEPNPRRLTVKLDGETLADTVHALTLREANYPPVHYIPRADVAMARLRPSPHATYCPYKGECSYFDLPGRGAHRENSVWSYEAAYPSVAAVTGHIAFYPERVDISEG